ncbi:MAG: DUF2058 family protein [Thiotrichales bacterium]
MKNILQEQLMKAGLVTEEQVKAANRKPEKRSKKPAKQAPRKTVKAQQKKKDNLAAAYAARARQEKQEEAEKQNLARERKQNRARLRELVLKNKLNDPTAEVAYQFVVGSNVKKVYVTEKQREELISGQLAITFVDGKRCIIPGQIADEVRRLDPEKILIQNQPDASTDEQDIPDDLIW